MALGHFKPGVIRGRLCSISPPRLSRFVVILLAWLGLPSFSSCRLAIFLPCCLVVLLSCVLIVNRFWDRFRWSWSSFGPIFEYIFAGLGRLLGRPGRILKRLGTVLAELTV